MTTSPSTVAASLPAEALRQSLLADRARALTRLYQQGYPLVRRAILRQGGLEQDARDIFQDALVLLYEQATGGTLVLTASASTYLVGISRNLWHQELRRRARLPQQAFPKDWKAAATEAADTLAEPSFAVLDYVEQLGERCKSLLLNFYYFQQPLSQIAEAQGYGSVRSATVQKFKCLERLRHAVRAACQAAPCLY